MDMLVPNKSLTSIIIQKNMCFIVIMNSSPEKVFLHNTFLKLLPAMLILLCKYTHMYTYMHSFIDNFYDSYFFNPVLFYILSKECFNSRCVGIFLNHKPF